MIIVFIIIALLCIGIPLYISASPEIQGILLGAAIFIAVISTVFGFCYELNKFSCEKLANKQGFEYDYGLFEGCMVKYEGKWRAYDKLFYTERKKD